VFRINYPLFRNTSIFLTTSVWFKQSMKTCLYGLDILFLSPMSDMQDTNKPYPGSSHELLLVTLLLLLGWVSEEFYYCLGGWCSQCTTTATTWPCNYTKQSHLSSYPNTSFCYMPSLRHQSHKLKYGTFSVRTGLCRDCVTATAWEFSRPSRLCHCHSSGIQLFFQAVSRLCHCHRLGIQPFFQAVLFPPESFTWSLTRWSLTRHQCMLSCYLAYSAQYTVPVFLGHCWQDCAELKQTLKHFIQRGKPGKTFLGGNFLPVMPRLADIWLELLDWSL